MRSLGVPLILLLVVLAACNGAGETPTSTPLAKLRPGVPFLPVASPSPAGTPSATLIAVPRDTPTTTAVTAEGAVAPSPGATSTPTPATTPVATPSQVPAVATSTPVVLGPPSTLTPAQDTSIATPAASPTGISARATPTRSPTPVIIPTPTAAPVPTTIPSVLPVATPVLTATPTLTATPAATSTPTSIPTASPPALTAVAATPTVIAAPTPTSPPTVAPPPPAPGAKPAAPTPTQPSPQQPGAPPPTAIPPPQPTWALELELTPTESVGGKLRRADHLVGLGNLVLGVDERCPDAIGCRASILPFRSTFDFDVYMCHLPAGQTNCDVLGEGALLSLSLQASAEVLRWLVQVDYTGLPKITFRFDLFVKTPRQPGARWG